MHGFVQTKEGRAYTAISRVPQEISSSMMTLNTIGGIIGWLFALRGGPDARNGYMYTGVCIYNLLSMRKMEKALLSIRRVFPCTRMSFKRKDKRE